MKKAQTEILGLAVVVVLIIIATVLVAKFGFRKTTDIRTDFVNSEEASNILNTFLKTSASQCSQLTMTELLQDCTQSNGLVCSNGQDSCSFVQSTATKILSGTLDAEKKKYEFIVCSNFNVKEIKCYDSTPMVKVGNECAGQKKLKIFPIPINSGTIYTKLEICG